MRWLTAFFALCGFLAFNHAASAAVSIDVDLSTQTMHVSSPATGQVFDWRVSTAASGFATPHGVYHPQSLQVMHYSHKYHNSPMPHSIFFHGGYAIHGTYSVAQLGQPASHGCVRLDPQDAALLFNLVKSEGADIRISGTPPRGYAVDNGPHHHKKKILVASRHKHHHRGTLYAGHRSTHHALAYAPYRHPAPLKKWLHNPAGI